MISPAKNLCLVAILRDEAPFVHEWLAYHRLLGVDHFFLYDDEPGTPLAAIVAPHRAYVTVIPWHGVSESMPGRNRQTKAYMHALPAAREYRWVSFLDADEFIVLRRHADLRAFLAEFEEFEAVSLQWHLFGHNGHFEDPKGLVTSSLTRRSGEPEAGLDRRKSISKTANIWDVASAHYCNGPRAVDANKRRMTPDHYPGKTDVAHINHYVCRSYQRWMNRAERGDVNWDTMTLEEVPEHSRWKVDRQHAQREFVENVAPKMNEVEDTYLERFREPVLNYLTSIGVTVYS